MKTKFITKKLNGIFYVLNRAYDSASLNKLLENPDQVFAFTDNCSFLKNGDTTTVVKIRLDDRYIVIKRYNQLGFWHSVRRGLRCSRAKRCWKYAWHLLDNNILTAKPIAFVEKKEGLFTKSYFVSEYLDGISARDFFDANIDLDSSSLPIAHRIADIINQLFAKSFIHGDLKATNILLIKEQPYLIDLDSTKQTRIRFILNRANRYELRRFMRNWLQQPLLFNFFCRHLKIP